MSAPQSLLALTDDQLDQILRCAAPLHRKRCCYPT